MLRHGPRVVAPRQRGMHGAPGLCRVRAVRPRINAPAALGLALTLTLAGLGCSSAGAVRVEGNAVSASNLGYVFGPVAPSWRPHRPCPRTTTPPGSTTPRGAPSTSTTPASARMDTPLVARAGQPPAPGLHRPGVGLGGDRPLRRAGGAARGGARAARRRAPGPGAVRAEEGRLRLRPGVRRAPRRASTQGRGAGSTAFARGFRTGRSPLGAAPMTPSPEPSPQPRAPVRRRGLVPAAIPSPSPACIGPRPGSARSPRCARASTSSAG
jgi:hypothetical protein